MWNLSSLVRQPERNVWEAWWAAISSGLCYIYNLFIIAGFIKRTDRTSFHSGSLEDVCDRSWVSTIYGCFLPNFWQNTYLQLLSGNFSECTLGQQLLNDKSVKVSPGGVSSFLMAEFKCTMAIPCQGPQDTPPLQGSSHSSQEGPPLAPDAAQLLWRTGCPWTWHRTGLARWKSDSHCTVS